MKLNIIWLFAFFLTFENFPWKVNTADVNQNSSFLIIGSSVPALMTGWILSNFNVNVTITYSTPDIDNYLSTTITVVDGATYELPKIQPVIFENSKQSQFLINNLNKNLYTENGFYVFTQNQQSFPVYSSESYSEFLNKLVKIGCIKAAEVVQLAKFIYTIQHYDYVSFRLKYSNITLAKFSKLMGTPESFLNCAINLLTLNTGMTKDNFNAADALARMEFYFFQIENPLRSYYIKTESFIKKPIKGLIDQIVIDMKSRNVKFVANHITNGLYVDAEKGIILGDLSDMTKTYDYVILGESFETTKKILKSTYDDNTGAPKIFKPLEQVLTPMEKYSLNTDVASVKIWLNKRLWWSDHLIEVIDSPFPYSIQSIKRLTQLTIPYHLDTVLEVVVVGTNGSRVIDFEKIHKELVKYLPSMKDVKINMHRVDWIDMGVIMNTDYGKNRLTTSSLQNAGIKNLVLVGNWLDAENSTAADLERDIIIANQALNDFVYHE